MARSTVSGDAFSSESVPGPYVDETLPRGGSPSSSLESLTDRLLSLDLPSLGAFLKRFSEDPRLLLALRLPVNARPGPGAPAAAAGEGDSSAVASVAAMPLEFHQLYSSIDCLLMIYETQALQLYSRSYPQMVDLQEQLRESETALEALEAKLTGIRGDLRRTGEKIQVVEDESIRLGTMMTNRREAGVVLKTFLQQITVERDLVKVICEGSVAGGAFVAALKQLTKKIEHAKQPGMQELKSASTSLPELQKLRECALSRASSHLAAKIALLRQPRTNVHIIQQNDLLKSSELFTFLLDHNPSAALAFKDLYTRTISQVYANLFRVYVQQLRRLQTQRDGVAFGAGGVGPSLTGTAAAALVGGGMGEEVELLASRENTKTASTLASSAKQVMDFMMAKLNNATPNSSMSKGSVFWSHQKLLIDTATREFLFLTGFFLNAGLACHYENLFAEALGKSLAYFVDLVETTANSTHDAIEVLLMLRITHFNAQVMKRRRIPCLDHYLKRIHDILHSALKAILSANVTSLLNACPHSLMLHQSDDVRLHPHFVTRRFAELASALEAIRAVRVRTKQTPACGGHSGKGDEGDAEEEQLFDLALMREMLDAALDLIVRLSQEIPTRRERTIFLINNYDLLLNIFHQRQVLPDGCTAIEKQLYEQISFFADEQLQRHFGTLLAAVIQAEEALQQSGAEGKTASDRVDVQQLENAVVQFGAEWKQRLGEMHAEAVAAFSNFTNGMEILKQTLTQLLLLHTRLHQVVGGLYSKPSLPPWAKQLLPTSAILSEIRSLSRAL
ncbi:Vps52 / Sac2 family protein [Toxoplasma gondii ME49]|uniref:Vps52 / Sac2 family protein n=10 Tax=Toxoplasma gondii TaxID=5811 RepID=A0A125YFA9_TOXGV|nr:Vps52 / Sac2 family protein [Toxoplasma gondii ME49]EPT29384.1 Vps52 / Sac2 family protein [Toxoplasma gondii ME49]ESS32238.1 Vps52 / Sac2 family protein [Toxoplasma gondii VEG]KFG33846.1 Vps52 / Sac2 family protein [Toxoplasma gondii GAB2-2007-GAL-DOM2]PIM05127.1 Vps52 / Sac2 family protein [Toxoplasma gondii COUG]|eukprot:XP_018637030.1 Vps52 / Sac2 family protein [Toxoplasma gondii ME49]